MLQAIQIESKLTPKNVIYVKAVQLFLDIFVLTGVFWLAYQLRFDFLLPDEQTNVMLSQMLYVVPLQLCVLRLCRVHKFIWRYVGILEMNRVLSALLLATMPLLLARFAFAGNSNFAVIPLSIILTNFFLAAGGILGIRFLRRAIHESPRFAKSGGAAATEKKSVLLIGAGRAGVMTLAQLKAGHRLNYSVKGFIDDDSLKQKQVINGIEVIGKTRDIPRKVRELNIDHVIITLAHASRRDIQRILSICKSVPVPVKTIPSLSEILDEKVIVSHIRNVEVQDLLGRTPVELDRKSIEEFLAGKAVLITGAGGSIGSELVRQLLHCRTEKLILVERSEFALFNIENEIKASCPQCRIVSVLADIGDRNRMEKVFRRYQPQVVFHAAAHKHVPMMEENAVEALKNNVLGTHAVGLLAAEHKIEAFVLISTDKAVNPTSVMGASKRVAELVTQDLNARFQTRFVAVRFGNVINSNGSVIPIFREQIKNGGPLTVTHPDMERFFMTIPEASQLVLQAGAIGAGGDIMILDMGEPVKILDLAEETIRLSGLEPNVDIQIVFTGMRPGEKLYEELETNKERLTKTTHSKIFVGQINSYTAQESARAIEKIKDLCAAEDDAAIRFFLTELLPEARLTLPPSQTTAKTAEAIDSVESEKELVYQMPAAQPQQALV